MEDTLTNLQAVNQEFENQSFFKEMLKQSIATKNTNLVFVEVVDENENISQRKIINKNYFISDKTESNYDDNFIYYIVADTDGNIIRRRVINTKTKQQPILGI